MRTVIEIFLRWSQFRFDHLFCVCCAFLVLLIDILSDFHDQTFEIWLENISTTKTHSVNEVWAKNLYNKSMEKFFITWTLVIKSVPPPWSRENEVRILMFWLILHGPFFSVYQTNIWTITSMNWCLKNDNNPKPSLLSYVGTGDYERLGWSWIEHKSIFFLTKAGADIIC